jgi:hypothetical protein
MARGAVRVGCATGWVRRLSWASLLCALTVSTSTAHAGDVAIEGVLADGVSADQLEAKLLRRPTAANLDTLYLAGLHVLRFEEVGAWTGEHARSLTEAVEGPDGANALDEWLERMEDRSVAGPGLDGVGLTFGLPGADGGGRIDFVPPPLLGRDLPGLLHGDRFRVRTALEATSIDGRGALEGVTVQPRPARWAGGPPPTLRTSSGHPRLGWVEYKGRRPESSDDHDKLAELVSEAREATSVDARRGSSWPESSSRKSTTADALHSFRVETSVLESGGEIRALRAGLDALEWRQARVKHPTRVSVSTLSLAADVAGGDGIERRDELLVFVARYEPLFVSLSKAALLLGESPREVVRAVVEGELPFFDVDGRAVLYSGHLRAWSEQESPRPGPDLLKLSDVEEQIQRWARSPSLGRSGRTFERIGGDRSHWPLRLVSSDSSGATAKVRVSSEELAGWLSRLVQAFDPADSLPAPPGVVPFAARGLQVDLGSVLGTASVSGSVPVARAEGGADRSRGRASGGSEAGRDRDEEARRRRESAAERERQEEAQARKEADVRRAEARKQKAAEARRAEAQEREEEEAEERRRADAQEQRRAAEDERRRVAAAERREAQEQARREEEAEEERLAEAEVQREERARVRQEARKRERREAEIEESRQAAEEAERERQEEEERRQRFEAKERRQADAEARETEQKEARERERERVAQQKKRDRSERLAKEEADAQASAESEARREAEQEARRQALAQAKQRARQESARAAAEEERKEEVAAAAADRKEQAAAERRRKERAAEADRKEQAAAEEEERKERAAAESADRRRKERVAAKAAEARRQERADAEAAEARRNEQARRARSAEETTPAERTSTSREQAVRARRSEKSSSTSEASRAPTVAKRPPSTGPTETKTPSEAPSTAAPRDVVTSLGEERLAADRSADMLLSRPLLATVDHGLGAAPCAFEGVDPALAAGLPTDCRGLLGARLLELQQSRFTMLANLPASEDTQALGQTRMLATRAISGDLAGHAAFEDERDRYLAVVPVVLQRFTPGSIQVSVEEESAPQEDGRELDFFIVRASIKGSRWQMWRTTARPRSDTEKVRSLEVDEVLDESTEVWTVAPHAQKNRALALGFLVERALRNLVVAIEATGMQLAEEEIVGFSGDVSSEWALNYGVGLGTAEKLVLDQTIWFYEVSTRDSSGRCQKPYKALDEKDKTSPCAYKLGYGRVTRIRDNVDVDGRRLTGGLAERRRALIDRDAEPESDAERRFLAYWRQLRGHCKRAETVNLTPLGRLRQRRKPDATARGYDICAASDREPKHYQSTVRGIAGRGRVEPRVPNQIAVPGPHYEAKMSIRSGPLFGPYLSSAYKTPESPGMTAGGAFAIGLTNLLSKSTEKGIPNAFHWTDMDFIALEPGPTWHMLAWNMGFLKGFGFGPFELRLGLGFGMFSGLYLPGTEGSEACLGVLGCLGLMIRGNIGAEFHLAPTASLDISVRPTWGMTLPDLAGVVTADLVPTTPRPNGVQLSFGFNWRLKEY